MMTDKTTKEESQDQTTVDSDKKEQPTEESQDQPTTEVEEGEADDSDEGESEVVEIDGVAYTPEELKEYVNKGKDYTKKTQQLAEDRRAFESERTRQQYAKPQQPAVNEEDEEVKQAQATLRKYGVAFAPDVDEKIRQSLSKSKLDQEFEIFQRQKKLSPEMAALVRVAGNAYKMTYEEAYNKFWGNNTQIVKRKIVGAKKVASSPISGKSGGGITRADIASMDPKKYKQLVDSGELDRMIRDGELK